MEQTLLMDLVVPEDKADATSRLRNEYQAYQKLFQIQQPHVRQDLEMQAALLSESVTHGQPHVHFHLPDRIECSSPDSGQAGEEQVPLDSREQHLGGRTGWLVRADLVSALRQRFAELEGSPNRAISAGSVLLRHATVVHMVHTRLPAGRVVVYKNVVDDIPNQPVDLAVGVSHPLPSIQSDQGRGDGSGTPSEDLAVPYVKDALRFFLPQWVGLDNQGNLLTSSVSEAEAYITSMLGYMSILASAAVLAPYIIVDEGWQQKHYGMLGQLVNQGRALARYQAGQIVQTIRHRAAQHRLDRGLWLSLPYFDDQELALRKYEFIIIPAGRVMFIPAFAVLSAREQQVKVAGNIQLSYSTRKHLLALLRDLELAFTS